MSRLLTRMVVITIICMQAAAVAGESGQKPNFLFIMVDDLGWADIGTYGADLHETPNIDAFASSGLKFTDGYAAASICSPTRAALYSGKSPAKLNMTIWREQAPNPWLGGKLAPPVVEANLPHSEVTIAEALRDAGYVTAHLGKWHVGDAAHFPETQGFDINIGATIWGAPPTFFYPYRGVIYRSFRFTPGLERDASGRYNLDREGEYLTDRLTDEAIAIIERFQDQPFFINLSYYTVHTPIEAKSELVEYYRKRLKPGMVHTNAIYAAMVHILDDNIGRLLNKLDELDLAKNTVVVFTSDNGGFINQWDGEIVTSNAPLRSGKGALYEGGIRVPTLVRWPGLTKTGTVSDYPMTTLDFYPTFLDMAGIEGDSNQVSGFEGESLVGVLKNPDAAREPRTLFWHFPHYYATSPPVSAIRHGDWKVLEFFEDRRVELYNLREDPGERTNLAEQYSGRTSRLIERLRAWRQMVDAPMPGPNPEYEAR